MKLKRKFICFLYVLTLLVSGVLGGCSAKQGVLSSGSEEITLVDPVGVAASYDVAEHRDMYNTEVYGSVCSPKVSEAAYNTELPFDKYGKLPGATVTAGDILVYGDTSDLDEEYELLSEEIEEKNEDHNDAMTDLQEDLEDANWKLFEAGFVESAHRYAELARDKVEQSIKEKEELYALESGYDQGRLDRLGDKITQARVLADTQATVVAVGNYQTGEVVAKNTSVIAVGDSDKKILYTDYVSKAAVEKASDVYAVVNGKRYEVTYQVMEQEEYTRQKRLNGTVHTAFELEDPDNEVTMGQYAVVVLVKEAAMDTLAVLSDAVYQEEQEYYCYLYDGKTSVRTSVEVGMKDGLYTEIISGLQAGDKVLTQKAVTAKEKMHTLEKGSLSYDYLGVGTLYYPSKEWIENPAEEGIFYLKEICVEKHEQVEKGHPIAKVEIISDQTEIDRIERKISRQQERLNELLAEAKKGHTKEEKRILDRSIESRQKAIADLQENLNELTQYTGEITITAPYAGIITDLTDIETDELISKKEELVEIADQSQCYIALEDESRQLSYGKEVTVSLMLGKSVEKEITGTVVSVSGNILSDQLNTGQVFISISGDDAAEIAKYGSTANADGDWSRNRFEVRTKIRETGEVVLVPQNAVTQTDHHTYVKVKEKDGRITYVSFIAGGIEQNQYWAAYGLSEGMEICLE